MTFATIMPDLTEAEVARTDFGTLSPRDQFFDDMLRVTRWRCDGPDLASILVERSFATIAWLQRQGRPFPTELWPAGVAKSTDGSNSGAGSRSRSGAAGRA